MDADLSNMSADGEEHKFSLRDCLKEFVNHPEAGDEAFENLIAGAEFVKTNQSEASENFAIDDKQGGDEVSVKELTEEVATNVFDENEVPPANVDCGIGDMVEEGGRLNFTNKNTGWC